MEEKNQYYYLIKGKNNLIKNYGWYYDFSNNLYDFKNNEIHYKDVVEKGRKKDFKGVQLSLFKNLVLEKDNVLVQSIYKIMCSKEFKEKNEKTVEKLKTIFAEEWTEIFENVEQHKENPFTQELIDKYNLLKEMEEKEMRKKIKEISNEENDALNEYALYLTDKLIYDKITEIAKNKLDDFTILTPENTVQFYVDEAMKLALDKGEYLEYDEQGLPIFDEEDWYDLTHWKLRISTEKKDKFKYIVNICNSKIMYEYTHCDFIRPFIEKELENNMFKIRNISNSNIKGGEFYLDEKGIIHEKNENNISNLQADIDEFEDLQYENEDTILN